MFSLKKIAQRTLLFLFLFVVLSFAINFYFVPLMRTYSEDNDRHMETLQNTVVSMSFPIKVVENVTTQVLADAKNAENIKLVNAFNQNQSEVILLSQEFSESLKHYIDNMQNISRLSLNRHGKSVNGLLKDTNSLYYSSQRILSLMEGSYIDTVPMEILWMHYDTLSQSLADMRLRNDALNQNIFQDATFLLNGIFIVFFILLAMFSFVIYKYVLSDIAFIIKSFAQMESRQYDFEQLPKIKALFIEEKKIITTVKDIIEEEKFTKEVKDLIETHYMIDDVIESLFEKLHVRMGVDRIGIAFADYSRKKIVAEIGVANFDKILLGPGFEVPFHKTALAEVLDSKRSFITADLEEALKVKPTSAALRLLNLEGIKSNMVIPLVMGDAVFGMVFFSSLEKNHFTAKNLRLAEKIINEISGLLNRAYFTKVVFSKITNSFAELVDQKDNETGDHIMRMVKYSVTLAEALRIKNIPGYQVTRKFVLEIERNASAHDIGKVGVPDEILKKPGKLTPDEWSIMKNHVGVGADIFMSLREGLRVFHADFYKFAEEIARYHHERWDGSGYPEGLSGEAIPLSARIVALADVFDAITSKRVYKQPFSFEQSVQMIKDASGTHLDPVLVEVFLENIEKIWEIYQDSE